MNDFIIDIPTRIVDLGDLNLLCSHMTLHKGSDLFFMGGDYVWMSRYGRNYRITNRKLQDKEVVGILAMIYGDNAESRLGGGGRIDTAHDYRVLSSVDEHENELYDRFRFRVNGVSCFRYGNRSATLTIRAIPTTPPSLKDFYVEKEIVDVFMNSSQGFAAVVGATGNGKSTLLAALNRAMLEEEDGNRNLVTIESPIEFVHDDYFKPSSFCTQIEVGSNIESFNDGVENAMRMAPTTIMVGETRSLETMKASVDASTTGHFVSTTMHANSVDATFQRAMGFYPEEMQLQAKIQVVQSLSLIVAQRLLKTVDGGRTAIRSFLVLDQQVKHELLNSKNIVAKSFELLERGFGKAMMVDVEQKYKDGLIDAATYKEQTYNYKLTRETYN